MSIWGQARGGRSRSREGSRAARRPGGGGEVARATEASAERARLTRPGVGPTVGGGGVKGEPRARGREAPAPALPRADLGISRRRAGQSGD